MEKKDLSDKFNLMEITLSKLDQLDKNKVGQGVHIALLYGMPVILTKIGKNITYIQDKIADLSKYNHPSLALNYGFLIDKENSTEVDYTETDDVYVVRELVKGKNFHNLSAFHIHDRLVLLYKLVCLLEFLHSFDVYYYFLHPTKIIITDDLEVKVVDLIKIDEDKYYSLRSQVLDDEARFIHPDLLSDQVINLEKLDNKQMKLSYDLYEFGCLLYYAVTGEVPWIEYETRDEINNAWISTVNNNYSKVDFLRDEDTYNPDMKRFYSMIDKLLCGKYESTEKLREEFSEIPEVKDYLKNDTLMFDFAGECDKVVQNINDLVTEIEKLFDDNNLPKHFNTIHQSRLKFSNNQDIDTTKATKYEKNKSSKKNEEPINNPNK